MVDMYGIIVIDNKGKLIPIMNEGSDDNYMLQMYHIGMCLRGGSPSMEIALLRDLGVVGARTKSSWAGAVWGHSNLTDGQQQVFSDLNSGKRELSEDALPKILEELGPRDSRERIPIDEVLGRLLKG